MRRKHEMSKQDDKRTRSTARKEKKINRTMVQGEGERWLLKKEEAYKHVWPCTSARANVHFVPGKNSQYLLLIALVSHSKYPGLEVILGDNFAFQAPA